MWQEAAAVRIGMGVSRARPHCLTAGLQLGSTRTACLTASWARGTRAPCCSARCCWQPMNSNGRGKLVFTQIYKVRDTKLFTIQKCRWSNIEMYANFCLPSFFQASKWLDTRHLTTVMKQQQKRFLFVFKNGKLFLFVNPIQCSWWIFMFIFLSA